MVKRPNSSLHQPHDGIFRLALKHRQAVYDFLCHNLSKKVLSGVDLESLILQKGSFISPEFKRYESDVVYAVRTKHGDGYVYLLLEHQSKEDKIMPLRLLEYNVQLMRQHIAQHGGKLPAIFNIVLYAGKEAYKGSRTLEAAFESPKMVHDMFRYNFLIDLERRDNKEVLKDGKAALMELTLKDGKKDPCKFLREGGEHIRDLINSSLYGNEICIYLLEHEKHDKETLLTEMRKLSPERTEYTMNAVEQIRQDSVQQERKALVRKLREEGVSARIIKKVTGLTLQEIEQEGGKN